VSTLVKHKFADSQKSPQPLCHNIGKVDTMLIVTKFPKKFSGIFENFPEALSAAASRATPPWLHTL